MDPSIQLDHLPRPSIPTALAYGILFLYGLHFVLKYLDLPLLSPQEIIWNAVVYVLPTPLLLDSARRQELKANGMLSQTHAAKGDALRRIVGVGGNAILQKLPSASETIGMGAMMRRASTSFVGSRSSDVPAGLGNWDNSCYQNSVLQALSSLGSLRSWLAVSEPTDAESGSTANTALQEMIARLRNPNNNGGHIWTPAKLKSMSSWQQQDAQEYFSKIMDELDKEAAKAFGSKEVKPGLEVISEEKRQEESEDQSSSAEATKGPFEDQARRNPLEGLVAQRVACTRCGFSEGYSMIPFNCLTVPLGSQDIYDLDECLDKYTEREDIEGVECRSCTLLHAKERLNQLQLPPELRGQIAQRLQAIEKALDEDDFSDKTLKQECQIPAKAYVSSTKSKEAIVGRAPRSLAIHVNRSVFDPMTGMQRKNYAKVRYPPLLDLKPWMLDFGHTPAQYRLSAVVTHYGRHENGHYICYRKHPRAETVEDAVESEESILTKDFEGKEDWWRLSDEDVSRLSEEEVLGQGGVFMLFYERTDDPRETRLLDDISEAAAIPLPPDEAADWQMVSIQPSTATPSLVTSSAQSVISESDTDITDVEPDEAFAEADNKKPLPAAPMMRTASPTYIRPAQKDMKHDLGMNRSLMSV